MPRSEQELRDRSLAAIKHLWPNAGYVPEADEFHVGEGFCLCRAQGWEVWWKSTDWLTRTDFMYRTGAFNPSSFPRSTS